MWKSEFFVGIIVVLAVLTKAADVSSTTETAIKKHSNNPVVNNRFFDLGSFVGNLFPGLNKPVGQNNNQGYQPGNGFQYPGQFSPQNQNENQVGQGFSNNQQNPVQDLGFGQQNPSGVQDSNSQLFGNNNQNYPGQIQNYPGQIQNYPGQIQNYPGQNQNYPDQNQNYPGQNQNQGANLNQQWPYQGVNQQWPGNSQGQQFLNNDNNGQQQNGQNQDQVMYPGQSWERPNQNQFSPQQINQSGRNPNQSISGGEIDSIGEQTNKPITSTTAAPTTSIECERNCPVTEEYDPICGSNNVTYDNAGKFMCAKNCGTNIRMVRKGRCRNDAPYPMGL